MNLQRHLARTRRCAVRPLVALALLSAALFTLTAPATAQSHPSVQKRVSLKTADVQKNPAAFLNKQIILTCPVSSTVIEKNLRETKVGKLRVILREDAFTYLVASRKAQRILIAYHAEVMKTADTGELALFLKSGANFSR